MWKEAGGVRTGFFFFQTHLGGSPPHAIYAGSPGSSVQVFSAVTHPKVSHLLSWKVFPTGLGTLFRFSRLHVLFLFHPNSFEWCWFGIGKPLFALEEWYPLNSTYVPSSVKTNLCVRLIRIGQHSFSGQMFATATSVIAENLLVQTNGWRQMIWFF